jgi:general secretion pathway protein E
VRAIDIHPRALRHDSALDTPRRTEGNGDKNFGCLVVMHHGAIVKRHRLTGTRMLIGRGENADLRLNSQYVSINHSMFVPQGSSMYVVDLHSTNKTIVNGKSVREKLLVHGDVVRIGEFVVRYEAAPVCVSVSDLGQEAVASPEAKSDVSAVPVPAVIEAVEFMSDDSTKEDVAPETPVAPLDHEATDNSVVQVNGHSVLDDEALPTGIHDLPVVELAPDDAGSGDGNAVLGGESHSEGFAAEAVPEVDEAALAAAIAEGARSGRSALDILEAMPGIQPATLTGDLARIFSYSLLEARELMGLDADFELLPAAEARRRGCAVVLNAGRLTAVITDPFDADVRPWLEARVSSPLDWALAARGDLNAFISRHEQGMRAIDTALKGAHGELSKDTDTEDLSLASISRDSSPVVKLVRSTLYDALRANASDVHLEAGNAQLEIRYRIDGVLVQIASVPGNEIAEQVISRIKVMSELDIAERRVPQDGRFKSSFSGRAIDFRVSIMPSSYGEDAVLRVLDKQAITDQMTELRLDGLGFDERIVNSLRQLSALPHGMLLVTGPTGSGKTTTLYAAISETNTGMGKIVTIEDPVEYQLPGVLQIPVNEKKGLTFARGLRSILRHDPDKIMVGEIRDPETAQIAVQSALTGHLVFTTVHANNVFDVLSRFTHMGVDVHSFVAALNGILAQRLLRIICEHCTESITATKEMLRATGLAFDESREFNWQIGRGCSHCRGTGYRGRRAVGEVMVLNDELREAIVARAPVRQLKELAHKNNIRLIRAVALDLVRDGLTTIEEVNRVTAVS